MKLFKKNNEILEYLRNIEKRLIMLEKNTNQKEFTNTNQEINVSKEEYEKNIINGIKPEYAGWTIGERLSAAGFD